MKTYYHINKNIDCDWKKGDEIFFGKEDNFFWKSYEEEEESVTLNNEKIEIFSIANNALNTYLRKQPPPLKMKEYHFNPLTTLQETVDSLRNSITTCRELIFESIRKEFYPELPSRQKCIWLIQDNKESLEFWKKTIRSEHQKIFRVSIEGNIHRASHKWLIRGTYSLNKWYELAHNYWKGKDSGEIDDEILYEGKIKIIEEITLLSNGSKNKA